MSSGRSASRITDKVAGNVIVSGSGSVLIGDSAEGCADGACKGSPSVGSPVNPILGIKVLPGETDFALAAPSPFVFTRSYASDDARIGPLGQGWSVPGVSLYLEVSEAATVLVDPQGRRLTFGPLLPGEMRFSPSESLWLRRGGLPEGVDPADAEPWSGRWIGVPATAQREARCIVAMAVGSPSAFVFVERAGRWPLVQVCDRNGYTTSYQWSATGDLRGVQDSAGRLYAYVYQAVCPPTEADRGLRLVGVVLAHDPGRDGPVPATPFDPTAKGLDWLVRFSFDSEGNLAQVHNRMDQPIRYFGWREHILVRHGEPGGIDVRYTYDVYSPKGRVLTQVNADGLSYRFDYHPQHTVVMDSLGRVEEFHFEGEGGLQRLTAHVRADGSRISRVHDPAGRLITEIDPLGRVTRYRLDGEGHQIGVTRPDGSTLSSRHDPETGDEVERETAPGRRVRYSHDGRGNVITEVAPDGAETRFVYENPALPDRPTQIIDAMGGARHLAWNALGQPEKLTDCSGHTTCATHDHAGHLTSVTDAPGHTTRHERDRMGRLLSTAAPEGRVTRLTCDALGRVTSQTDALGQVTRFVLNRFGRVVRRVDPQGHTIAWTHDAAGRPLTLTNENGAVYRFRHDVMDRLIEETGFDGRCQRYVYNEAGELVERHDAGDLVTRHEHDTMGRTVRTHVPATPHAAAHTQHFAYDATGQLIEASTPDVTVTFRHDAAGRLLSETQRHADGWQYHQQHRYNARGVREASRYGDLPEVQWMTYGPGHLHGVRVGGVGLDFERDALHREVGRRGVLAEAAPGFESRSAYDAAGRLIGQQVMAADSSLVWSRAYRHDALDRVIGIRDSQAGLIAYRYDPSGRLVGSDHAGQVNAYRLDPAGNRVDRSVGADGRPMIWPDNRVAELAGTRYWYDGAGCVIERRRPDGDRLTLGHDGLQRVVKLQRSGPQGPCTVRYSHDAFGRRICKEVTDPQGRRRVTHFGWVDDRVVVEEQDGHRHTVVHDPGGYTPLLCLASTHAAESRELSDAASMVGALIWSAMSSTSDLQEVTCYQADPSGTPLRQTDLAGRLRWSGDSEDWAGVAAPHGMVGPQLRFPGQQVDDESGLHYNRHRYYEPQLGQYMTQDPIGLGGGFHLSMYADAAPTARTDPLGLMSGIPPVNPIVPIPGELPPSAPDWDAVRRQRELWDLEDKWKEALKGVCPTCPGKPK